MRTSSAILCFLATLTFASAGRLISPSDLELPALSDAPDFCHGLECPPFKLLKDTSKYQLREYEGGTAYNLSQHPESYRVYSAFMATVLITVDVVLCC